MYKPNFCDHCCKYVSKISKHILVKSKLSSGKTYDGVGLICTSCIEKDYFIKYFNCVKIESFDTAEELDIFYKKYSLLK